MDDNRLFQQQRKAFTSKKKAYKQRIKQAALDERNQIKDLMNIGEVFPIDDEERIRRRAAYTDFFNDATNKDRFKNLAGYYIRRIKNKESFDIY